jgi:hypothetical protein
VEGGHQPRQHHDLMAGLSRRKAACEQRRCSLSWGRLKVPSTESESLPRKVKLVVGMRLDFSQLMMKPAFINKERATCRLDKEIWNMDPKTKMSSR